ncbi:PNKP [Symbiodinium sp. CCMP2592]|nr:PNKP [Symbiodinium sp. CCMP2592]
MLMLTRSVVTWRSSLPAVPCSPLCGRCIFQGQKQMAMPGLMLKDSGLHGTGVFATRDFAAKEVLEVCTCLWIAKPSVAAFQPQAIGDIELLDYLFAADKGERGRLLLPLGFGLAYNHGVEGECNASYHVKLDVGQPRLIFRALRDIVFDEEVLIDYGEADSFLSYWSVLPAPMSRSISCLESSSISMGLVARQRLAAAVCSLSRRLATEDGWKKFVRKRAVLEVERECLGGPDAGGSPARGRERRGLPESLRRIPGDCVRRALATEKDPKPKRSKHLRLRLRLMSFRARPGPDSESFLRSASQPLQLKLLTSMGFPADASAAALEAGRIPPRTAYLERVQLVQAAAGDTNAAANSLLAELQVSSFFVELGPAAPRSPASCRATVSLKASRGGVLVGGGPGGLQLRVVVDLQPPRSLRGEPVGEADSTEGWEKLPDDGLRVALELESEATLEQWGVWLFVGQRFARITGPAVGCSASSIAATCCRSLATLRRLCPKANFHAEPPFQATVGEVLRRGYLQQMLDTGGVVPYFDRDDATVGGSMLLEDGAIVHKLPSGSMQRWKIREMTANPFGGDDPSNQVRQPAEEVLSIGSTVQYWSTTVQRWVSATVLALNEDGTYRLDIKKRASRQFIKEAAGAEESQEMPATAEPAVRSGSARVQGHASHASVEHEKVAAGAPGKRQRRARSSSVVPNKAKAKIRKKASTSSEKQSSSDSDSDRESEGSSSSETS